MKNEEKKKKKKTRDKRDKEKGLTPSFLEPFMSSRGTMSMRKSKTSVLVIAMAMSFLCRVLLLFSSVWVQALIVSSKMNISQALAKMMGASALIIYFSSQRRRGGVRTCQGNAKKERGSKKRLYH